MRDDAIELAGEILDRVAALPGLRIAVITGSVARGLADESSDLDVYLYWDQVDVPALSRADRFASLGASPLFGVPTATGWFDKLQHDGRYLDIESVAFAALESAATQLTGTTAPPGWAVKIAAGLRDAVVIHGAEELARWRERLAYGDAVAAAEVALRAPRLLAPSAIFELTYARGDVLAFTARTSQPTSMCSCARRLTSLTSTSRTQPPERPASSQPSTRALADSPVSVLPVRRRECPLLTGMMPGRRVLQRRGRGYAGPPPRDLPAGR